ncbi:MAG: hypothetical protein U5K43_07175 [Halofilum sp. (in: g-proteobacteria)]|nr:hypothetical protein [Halofilum sp. (in: g-proteobacteria)]
MLVWLIAVASFAVIALIGRRHGVPRGYALAGYLALGIGIHNLGEGLAIGGAVAAGELALGTFLVLGFTLHNVTEGIGIAAPDHARARASRVVWLGLIALAGLPAVLGHLDRRARGGAALDGRVPGRRRRRDRPGAARGRRSPAPDRRGPGRPLGGAGRVPCRDRDHVRDCAAGAGMSPWYRVRAGSTRAGRRAVACR